MRTQDYHKYWLKITALVIGSFGPIFLLGSTSFTNEPAKLTLDLLSWPIDGKESFNEPTTRFLSALTGGFLIGWGITVWFLSSWVYDLAPEQVRKTVLIGIISWFFTDSLGSILSYNYSNVLFNLFILVIAVGPLWLPAKKEKSYEK